MFRVIDEAEKRRVVDEALKGEKTVDELAADTAVSRRAIYDWLERHYTAHPEDPRRHRVQRNNGKWPTDKPPPLEQSATEAGELNEPGTEETAADDAPGADAGADNDEARDDMGAKKRSGGPNHSEEKRKQALHILATEDVKQVEVAKRLGVTQSAVSYWVKHEAVEKIKHGKMAKFRAAVIADIKAGYAGGSLIARHKNLGKTTVFRFLREFRQEQEALREKKRVQMAHARRVHHQRLKDDPAYAREYNEKVQAGRRQAEPSNGVQPALPFAGESTVMSRPDQPHLTRPPQSEPAAVSRSLVVVQHRAEFPPDSQLGQDVLRECIEERSTLRGMVTLLQREAEELKKTISIYQRTFGDIRR